MEKFFFYSRIVVGIIMLTIAFIAWVRYFTFVFFSVAGLVAGTTLFIAGIILVVKKNMEIGP